MRTEDLINALAADPPAVRPGPGALLPLAAGIAIMILGYGILLDARPDIAEAARSAAFILKLAAAALLAVAAAGTLVRLARPGRSIGPWPYALLLPILLLGGGVVATIAGTPASDWGARLVGTNALACLTVIPALAAAPLAGAIVWLRSRAPTRPASVGALAGILAGSLAAVLYGTTCIDDSPLFVATWYLLAIATVAAAGALLGQRFLRW
ncbi:MAG: DUF1109 family protein [Bauldia sp.]|nr:DUF1109 family protein [Bauldia sp.]